MKKGLFVLSLILVSLTTFSQSQYSSVSVSYYDNVPEDKKIGFDILVPIPNEFLIGFGATFIPKRAPKKDELSVFVSYGKDLKNIKLGTRLGVGVTNINDELTGKDKTLTFPLSGLFLNIKLIKSLYLTTSFDSYNKFGVGLSFSSE